MKRRWVQIISLLIVALLAGGGIAFALTSWLSLPFDFNVVSVAASFQAYSDADATQPIVPPLHFGNIQPGGQLAFDFYMKNTGGTSANVSMRITEDTSQVLTSTFTPASAAIAPGQVVKFSWTATVIATSSGLKSYHFELYTH